MDFGEYVIQFKSVLVIPEIAKAFYNFLEKEYAVDNWNFVLKVNELSELSKKKNQGKIIKLAKTICSEYIVPEAPKKLFVGKTHQKHILQQVAKLERKRWNLDISAPELFEPLKKLIVLEYKNDSFKRFSREPECLKLLEKYKGNRNVLLPQLSMVYNYKDEDFNNRVFGQKDKEFLERFVEDNPNWELVFSNKKANACAFISNWNYFPNISFLTDTYVNTKNQIIFNYSLQEVACAIFSQYQHSDPHALEVKTIEYKPKTHVIFQQNTSMGPMTEPRAKRIIYTVDYNPEKKQLVVRGRPSQIEGVPFLKSHTINMVLKKGDAPSKTKAIQYFTYYTTILTELDDHRTLYEQIIAVDVGGVGVTKTFIEKRLLGLHANYSKLLKGLGDRKKIKDFKYEFNDLWEGIPLQPLGKLIYDLDIDGQNEEYRKKMEKRSQVFDLSNFVVHFTAINKKEIQKLYHEFLKKEFNSDSWDLIVDYHSLLKSQSKKKMNVTEKLKYIIDTYIKTGSKKYLPVPEQTSILENQDSPSKCIKILGEACSNIKLEHQLDSFKRFIATPEAKSILSKYQHDAQVMAPILNFVSVYNDKDFDLPQITEKDIHFCASLAENAATWDQVYSDRHSKISISNVNWFANATSIDSPIISVETKYDFDYPMEQVINGYFTLSKFNKVDPNVNKIKCVKYNEESNENYESVVLSYDMVWTWKQSFLKENVCAFTIEDNRMLFISKPIRPTDKNWSKKENDKIQYFQYEIVVLSRTTDQSTSFQHIMCISSSEKIDWNQKMIERNKSFHPSLESSISKANKTIEECKECYETKENEILKEPVGKLLLSVDFNNCGLASDDVTETEDLMSSIDDETTSTFNINFDAYSPNEMSWLSDN